MGQNQLEKCTGFQWDIGNHSKNWLSHGVNKEECEQLFFNQPLFVVDDLKHSQHEPRHYALGQTNTGRKLFIAFTVRENLIRVISARDMSKKERLYYEQENDDT